MKTKKLRKQFCLVQGLAWGLALLSLTGCGKTPEEEYAMGDRYHRGAGVEQSHAEAVKWWRRAAERGYADAQFALGLCYGKGEGVEKNFAEAVKWWRRAAEQNHAGAQFNLGLAHYKGDGVEKSHAEAVKLWLKAAEQGHAEAQFDLGHCFYDGDGTEKDLAKAAQWWLKAAEQGHVRAQFKSAQCCYEGHGVEKDHVKAVRWWREAAGKGHIDAQFYLAQCCYQGDGTKKDHAEAVRWWRMAADQGHKDAQFNLGVCLHNGDGVEKNIYEAVQWWLKAARNGNKRAVTVLLAPWEELRDKGVFGIRFGATFDPQNSEEEFFDLRTEECNFYKSVNYRRGRDGFADAAGLSITPKSHKVFRITGFIEDYKVCAKLKSLLEEKYHMRMQKYDDGLNIWKNMFDYDFQNEDFSIHVYYNPTLLRQKTVVVFTDRKLENLAKKEAQSEARQSVDKAERELKKVWGK